MDKKIITAIGISIIAAREFSILTSSKNKLSRNEGTASGEEPEEYVKPGIALNEFVSNKFDISFKYPKSWMKNPRYEDKYEGKTGFFQVTDFSGEGEDIDEAVKLQVSEPYNLYGKNPIIRSFIVDGQPARVIYPSEDQPSSYDDRDVALVVQYRTPLDIDGVKYPYVVVWTTREYLPLILSTFKFVNEEKK